MSYKTIFAGFGKTRTFEINLGNSIKKILKLLFSFRTIHRKFIMYLSSLMQVGNKQKKRRKESHKNKESYREIDR